jgi:hypothetical protein
MEEECDSACIEVEGAINDAATSGVTDGTTALPYLNNGEYGDDWQAVSTVLRADQPGCFVARTELIDEDVTGGSTPDDRRLTDACPARLHDARGGRVHQYRVLCLL